MSLAAILRMLAFFRESEKLYPFVNLRLLGAGIAALGIDAWRLM